MKFIKNYEIFELEQQFSELGILKYKAKQVFKWLHQGVMSFDEMTDISKKDRQTLSENFIISTLKVVKRQISKIDGTEKFLFMLHDGKLIESVFMKYKHGNTVCVSSQVGCKMGCKFCASGLFGLERNLESFEILDQIIAIQNETGEKVSNIVLMGTGEPLDNYENVLKFLRLVNAKDGILISHRHISVSTCGLVDKINMLADEKLQITLSVSLHSPYDDNRSEIMPINKKYNVNTLVNACKNYFHKTGRRISYEYTLIDKKTDTDDMALALSKLLKGTPCHVNLIPLNTVEETGLKKSSKYQTEKFQKILLKNGISATVRRTLGPDIDASCGQLRKREAGV